MLNCIAASATSALRPGIQRVATSIDAGGACAELQVDALPGVEFRTLQGDPFLRRRAGEIILGKIRTVARRRIVGAEHGELALEGWRSISAAAKPAAPPPTMTIRRGGSPVGG